MALEIVLLTHQYCCGVQAQDKLKIDRPTAKLIKSFNIAKHHSCALDDYSLMKTCVTVQ